jgi:hypothetical protein
VSISARNRPPISIVRGVPYYLALQHLWQHFLQKPSGTTHPLPYVISLLPAFLRSSLWIRFASELVGTSNALVLLHASMGWLLEMPLCIPSASWCALQYYAFFTVLGGQPKDLLRRSHITFHISYIILGIILSMSEKKVVL